jgi:rare lipoprotein A
MEFMTMKILPSQLQNLRVRTMKAGKDSANPAGKSSTRFNGFALVTLSLTLGLTASASDPGPQVKVKSQTDPGTKLHAEPGSPSTQPLAKTRRWYQVGLASWYGKYFHGKKTATGESFDMNGLTCAHRSLPLGSWIRVTNLRNRRSIFVRVNDRGPLLDDRIVDLSYGAAKAVGLEGRGLGRVKLEPLRPGDPDMARELITQLRTPYIPAFGQ